MMHITGKTISFQNAFIGVIKTNFQKFQKLCYFTYVFPKCFFFISSLERFYFPLQVVYWKPISNTCPGSVYTALQWIVLSKFE